ncbi:MAG: four helix bundle protein [Cyclobacteriaceae bacterium]
MDKKYLSLNDIEAYKIDCHLSNKVWEVVIVWNHFEKNTIGQQFVRSVDSISANIAEGFGRFGKKDKTKFYRYASGSLYESWDWNEKAKSRKLLTQDEYEFIFQELKNYPKPSTHSLNIQMTNFSYDSFIQPLSH